MGGHDLRRRKAQAAEYECDICGKDIATGKRFYDCRKCDWCICQRCYKDAEAELAAEEEDDADAVELMEAFCEMHTTAVRKGGRLHFKCDVCNTLLKSSDEVMPHMADNHMDAVQAFMADATSMSSSMPPFADLGLLDDEDVLEEIMKDMLGGGMPGMPRAGAQASSSGGASKGSRSRKKR